MRRYIFIEPDGDITHWLFYDLEKQDNIDVLKSPLNIPTKLLRILRKIHFSKKINSVIPLPLKNIWDRFYTIDKYEFKEDIEYYIILGNFAVKNFHVPYLKKLKSKGNIKIVLYFTDPICSEHAIDAFELTKKFDFDYIYTFDSADALKYGFLYTGLIYSYKKMPPQDIVSDIYFVGVNKNRLTILRKIYEKLVGCGIKCDFYVAGVENKEILNDGILYNQRCTYEEVVMRLQSYSTILEILQKGQSGVTLRYYEAVCYNKKLITNNPEIKNLPFYSPENMLFFQSIDEIDPEWFRNGLPNYGYKNEFSPVNWINRIGNEDVRTNRIKFYRRN